MDASHSTPSETAHRPRSILIVDDEELMRWFLAERFRSLGLETRVAPTGKEALGLFGNGAPAIDLVLCDLKLPDTDGLEVLSQIRRLSPATRVVIMTAYGTPGIQSKALRIGACCVLEKPFNVDRVSAWLMAGCPPPDAALDGGGGKAAR